MPGSASSGPNASLNPVPTHPQAFQSTYISRLRTGSTLLLQPSNITPSSSSVNASSLLTTSGRRRGVINYAEGDDDDDNFGMESDDDEEFTAIGERGGKRRGGSGTGGRSGSVPGSAGGAGGGGGSGSRVGSPGASVNGPVRAELDKSYLGMIPPSRFVSSKWVSKTRHEYPPLDQVEKAAQAREILIPIRIDLDTETHRIRDSFMWNLNGSWVWIFSSGH
ncbi:uncharacterized protein EI90DRAFT_3061361 [Cantharellus anzutake]|uniref:uncharacterized protein n=1 Tax=Cantharellus anzutake TaxID=1750568 RepID=UPI00190349A1|nr:uncharacterized protein EI90DRAFT_3076654 [Cantharellus anzutake]XP_038915267.1 uncharacterized protein EI90DRAFT_3061361 [Cantharellus anzutake]KAF8323635.1 hypothetical protein EI90DRAFT_3076654 [Cantharellus anzutake]KAF8330046.1 hypothetical protein EI90DRAFT_3061361 [Cantharellus anzutake]